MKHNLSHPLLPKLAQRMLVISITMATFVLSFSATQATFKAQNAPSNLISNGDFESGSQDWGTCGGSAIISAGDQGVLDKNIHEGSSVLRLGNPNFGSCGDSFAAPRQIAYQQIAIPTNVDALTISFWYSRRGAYFDDDSIFDSGGQLAIKLATNPLDGVLSTPNDIAVGSITPTSHRGWHFFRQRLDATDLAELRSGLAGNDTIFLTFGLSGFYEDEIFQSGDEVAYYIDLIEVVPDTVVTQASPLPADLAAIDNQPLIMTKYDPNHPSPVEGNSFSIIRLNPDGSNPVAIYPGLLALPTLPTWSNDGQRIAVTDRTVSNPTNLYASGLVSAFSTLNPDGSNVTEIFQTLGGGGNLDSSVPPELQLPNLNSRITGIEWSPDDTQVVVTTCFYTQGPFGFSDEECELQFRNSVSGEINSRIESGFRVDWNSNDQLLFGTDSFGELAPGIYEIDLAQNNGTTPTQLIRNWANEVPFHGDYSPSWAPDGQSFAIVRDLPSTFRDGVGELQWSKAIVLYDRDQLPADQDDPQFVLMVDHGNILGSLEWSPDGKYLLYSLFNSNENGSDSESSANVWWLEIETGKTGKVTNDGLSTAASWRPSSSGPVTPPANLDQRIYLPLLRK